MTKTIYLFSVTDLDTGRNLEPDSWGDEWESQNPCEDEIRQRASKFHNIPIEQISAHCYHQIEKE